MSCNNFISKLLDIQDISEYFVENVGEEKHIHLKHIRKKCPCPVCGRLTDKIHDYREQKVKDLSINGKKTYLYIRKRRYRCENCGKRFYEKTPYLARYARMTNRMGVEILECLEDTVSYTHVAKEYGISTTNVIHRFDIISHGKPELPPILAMDEFRGNTGGEKFNCIIADPLKKKVLDILPKRTENAVLDYLLQFPKEERDRVQYFISDMWTPYQDAARAAFGKSTRVIDRYHWIRQLYWAFERVRKDVQKHMTKERRIYFKHSRKLLLKPFAELSDDDKQAVNIMLYYSSDLSTAHFYKEEFQKIADCRSLVDAKKMMQEWIESAIECGVRPIEDCARTMLRWKTEILSSYNTSCTNGFVEGCNNRIKVLKRVSYGCRNFKRFRNRVLYIFNRSAT